MSLVVDPDDLSLRTLPDLGLPQLRFLVSIGDEAAKEKLMEEVKKHNMAPYYSMLCAQFKWDVDMALLTTMQAENEEQLKKIHARIEDAEQNLGENEVREAMLARAEHFAQIGAKAAAIKAFRITYDKTVPLGQRLDVVFSFIRLGMFFEDDDLIKRNLERATALLEEGGDWDRKNRLKVYQAVYDMSMRRFEKAAKLFLDTLSTFTSYELFDYDTLIFYAVITSIFSLDRPTLHSKVILSPEVLGVIGTKPRLSQLLNSLYQSEYKEFFMALADVTDELRKNRMLAPHASFFCREMRIKAYTQLLESYRSVQLSSMAAAFGVSTEFLDSELYKFVASGRLHCKVDKVGGIVETTRPDTKNAKYQAVIKQGDLLLNRIQKLSVVINA